jgi:predicted nuclease of restriction endonuclease-like (RecB) superfamily
MSSQTNFANALDAEVSIHAQLGVKDEYTFAFLELEDEHSERELERALTGRVETFLREMGDMFTFVGSQYKLQVGEREFFIDLLLYHRRLHALVALELLCGRPHKSSSVAQPVKWRSAMRAAIFTPFQYSNAT